MTKRIGAPRCACLRTNFLPISNLKHKIGVAALVIRQMKLTSFLFTLFLACFPYGEAFCGRTYPLIGRGTKGNAVALSSANRDNMQQEIDGASANDESRRAMFRSIAVSSAALFLSPTPSLAAAAAAAAADAALGSTPENPIVIIGASGKTGMEVAQALAREGLYCVTMSRSGRNPFKVVKLKPEVQSFIQHYDAGVNVLERESLEQALKDVNASAIIYCASASKQGGTAYQVDDEGVGYAAQAALDLKARLILVSALAVDRPNSKSYQVTNTLGGNFQGIMDAKQQGEEKVRSILSRKKNYVIVRPGVLLNGISRNGAIDMEVNQGDTIGGGLSRDELAGVVVGALISGKNGITVEVYRRSTATPLQPAFTIPSGNEASSTTYKGLFESVEPDSKIQSMK